MNILFESLNEPPSDLKQMEDKKNAAYLERNQVVAALAKCFPSGIAKTAIEGWHEEWHNCVYIDLPTGQASWHYHDSHCYLFDGLPEYTKPWDEHTTEEKYERLAALPQYNAEAPSVAYEHLKEDGSYIPRYTVAKENMGFWPFVVKGGTGERKIFVGSEKNSNRYASELNMAFLDGVFVAEKTILKKD